MRWSHGSVQIWKRSGERCNERSADSRHRANPGRSRCTPRMSRAAPEGVKLPSRLTADAWIANAQAVHGDRYEYTKVVYENVDSNVVIICRVHGEFEQRPANHTRGFGCSKCGSVSSSRLRRIPVDAWIAQMRELHGDRYDYSKVTQIRSKNKVPIICRMHGEFLQTPQSHAIGSDCPKCTNRYTMTTEEWVQWAQAVHGDRFGYAEVVYVGGATKVKIECPVHGLFLKSPNKHILDREGCPRCVESKGEAEVARVLDELGIEYITQWWHISCSYRRPLIFDFFLPAYGVLIEFDGRQHFTPVRWTKDVTVKRAKIDFVRVQHRDRVKTLWASANGYRLLRLRKIDTVMAELAAYIASIDPAIRAST